MSKDIPASLVAESQKNAVSQIILIKLEFDSGDARFHTNIGDVTFNSEVYSGVGDLSSITRTEENSQLSSSSVTVSLSGVNNSLLSIFLTNLLTLFFPERNGIGPQWDFCWCCLCFQMCC